jgi:hypothetical protein
MLERPALEQRLDDVLHRRLAVVVAGDIASPGTGRARRPRPPGPSPGTLRARSTQGIPAARLDLGAADVTGVA